MILKHKNIYYCVLMQHKKKKCFDNDFVNYVYFYFLVFFLLIFNIKINDKKYNKIIIYYEYKNEFIIYKML